MIRFDKEAPGGGVDAYTVLKNGKAEISFTVYLTESTTSEDKKSKESKLQAQGPVTVEITLYDPKGSETARMYLQPEKDALAKPALPKTLTTRTLVIYPQLWQSVNNPLLYQIKALITAEDTVLDEKQFLYPICSMNFLSNKGFFLNNQPFSLHAVHYPVAKDWRKYLEKDLDLLLELGANCICPNRFPKDSAFYEKCLEKGIILWKLVSKDSSIPSFVGSEQPLISADRLRKKDLFYYYQALWSNREVLHICTPEQSYRPGNTACAVVYSNQKKVALYINGILQEFKQTPPKFLFEDILLKGEHPVISVQAGKCFASVTWS